MTLFGILRKRIVTTATLLIVTLVATGASLFILPWTYSAEANVLVLPSSALAKPFGGNPYLAFNDTVGETANVLMYQITDARTALALQAAGYTSSYTAVAAPGASAPVLLITVTGNSKSSVESTLHGVTGEMSTLLKSEQADISPQNQLTTKIITYSPEPSRLTTKMLRPLLVIFGIGIVLTLAVPTAVDALAGRKKGRRRVEDNGTGSYPVPNTDSRRYEDMEIGRRGSAEGARQAGAYDPSQPFEHARDIHPQFSAEHRPSNSRH